MKWNEMLGKDNSDYCYVIAEAGLNHNGSLEIAKKMIDLAALAGSDAVKFQKRTVDKLANFDFTPLCSMPIVDGSGQKLPKGAPPVRRSHFVRPAPEQ